MERMKASEATYRIDRWGRRFFVDGSEETTDDTMKVLVSVTGGDDFEIGRLERWPAGGGRPAYWTWFCTLDGVLTESHLRFENTPAGLGVAFRALVGSGRVKARFDR